MNYKKLLLMLVVVGLVALAGCGEPNNAGSAKNLDKDTGMNVSDTKFGSSYLWEAKLTEKNQMNLVQKRPPFMMGDSLERQNLIRRYKYLNDQNNKHHVYLMSNDGKVIAYYVAQGKVSSVNSKLTNDLQPVRIPQCDPHKTGNDCWKLVESPQMDGSYGTNGNAIFFFTTDGKYVETNTKYVVSEEPMDIQTQVSLVEEVGDENSSGGSNNSTTTNSQA